VTTRSGYWAWFLEPLGVSASRSSRPDRFSVSPRRRLPGQNFPEKKAPPNFSTFHQKQIIFLVEPEKKFRVVYLLLVLYSIILPNFCGIYMP